MYLHDAQPAKLVAAVEVDAHQFSAGESNMLRFLSAKYRVVCCSMIVAGVFSSPCFAAGPESTHKQTKSLVPTFEGKKLKLNTFTLAKDGNLWMCCNDLMTANGEAPEGSAGCILITQPTGELVKRIQLDFAPTAINFAESGDVYVAGSGFIACLDNDGQVKKRIEAPNIVNREEALRLMKEEAEKQKEQMTEMYESQVKRLEEQLAKLQAQLEKADKDDERAVKRIEARIKALEPQLTSMKDISKQISESLGSQMSGEASLARVKRATGIAVSKQDVFVVLPNVKGYGYSLWRMTHDLENPVAIMDTMSGCCGQMDVQAEGDDVLVAENTAFRVSRYNREGKQIASFGERSREKESGWGSCCNPMNIRCVGSDEILTAESSIGNIKRYTKEGKYLGLVGTARIGGGCKHVALSVDQKLNRYYIMNENGGDIAVLVPKSEAVEDTQDEKDSREAREGLGKKLIGTWERQDNADQAKASELSIIMAAQGIEGYDADLQVPYKFMHLHFDGRMEIKKPTVAAAAAEKKKSAGLGALLSNAISAAVGTEASVPQTETAMVWEAVKQTENTVSFMIIEDGVRSYGGTVKLIEDDKAEVDWFYDSPENSLGQKVIYKRLPGKCCSADKPCEGCAGKCDEASKAGYEKKAEAEPAKSPAE